MKAQERLLWQHLAVLWGASLLFIVIASVVGALTDGANGDIWDITAVSFMGLGLGLLLMAIVTTVVVLFGRNRR